MDDDISLIDDIRNSELSKTLLDDIDSDDLSDNGGSFIK